MLKKRKSGGNEQTFFWIPFAFISAGKKYVKLYLDIKHR